MNRESDRWLVIGCVVGLIAVTFALVRADSSLDGKQNTDLVRAPVFGELEYVHVGLRRRAARSLAWEAVASGDTAHERDTLFVPPGGSAVLRTKDGARLVLEENSLVVLETNENARPSIELSRGSLTGTAAGRGLEIRSEGGRTEVSDQSSVRLDQKRISILSGDALVATTSGNHRLSRAQSANLTGSLELSTYAALLALPAPGARIYASGKVAGIELAWTGKAARVQISATPDFATLRADVTVDGEKLTWHTQDRGVRYWRLVSASGEVLSPISSFNVVDNLAPLLLSPRHLEQVTAPPPRIAVSFVWTPVEGAQTYTLDVARDATFATIDKTVTVKRTQALVFDLPEATYHWRVRAEGGERPRSPASAVRAFRLTHKPLVGAPELFDAEVELHAP